MVLNKQCSTQHPAWHPSNHTPIISTTSYGRQIAVIDDTTVKFRLHKFASKLHTCEAHDVNLVTTVVNICGDVAAQTVIMELISGKEMRHWYYDSQNTAIEIKT